MLQYSSINTRTAGNMQGFFQEKPGSRNESADGKVCEQNVSRKDVQHEKIRKTMEYSDCTVTGDGLCARSTRRGGNERGQNVFTLFLCGDRGDGGGLSAAKKYGCKHDDRGYHRGYLCGADICQSGDETDQRQLYFSGVNEGHDSRHEDADRKPDRDGGH